MKKLIFIALGIMTIVALDACKKTDPAATTTGGNLACTYTLAGLTQCVLYKAAATEAGVAAICSALSGTASATCSTTNALGTCTGSNSDANIQSTVYYSGGLLDATSAAASCSSNGGTWAAAS